MNRNVKNIVIFCFLLLPCIAMSSTGDYPDKIITQKNITGRLVSYVYGDYPHISLNQNDGSDVDFFIYNEACFLAKHREQLLEIKYQEVERYFVEGAGYYPANLILTIETKDGMYKWDSNKDKMSEGVEYMDCLKVLEQLNATSSPTRRSSGTR